MASNETGTTQKIKQRGIEQLEKGKTVAADKAQSLAGAVDDVAESVAQEHPTLAQYAHQVSGGMARLADKLRQGNIEDLISSAQTLARNNPALFIAGSVAVGFALSRFLKASSERAEL